jgi:hypothetical protein
MARVGWLKLWRKLDEHWLWEQKPFSMGQAWIDVLMRTNFSDSNIPNPADVKSSTLSPGESIVSLRGLEADWGWSRNRVLRFLRRLKNDGMIGTKNETIFTRVNVVNWKKYQPSADNSSVLDGTTNGTTNGTTPPTKPEPLTEPPHGTTISIGESRTHGTTTRNHQRNHNTPNTEPQAEPQAEPIRRIQESKKEENTRINTPEVLRILDAALQKPTNSTADRGDVAYLDRSKIKISLMTSETTQARMRDFLGYLENKPDVPYKRIEEIIRKLFALRESLNLNDNTPSDRIFCYALDQAINHDALQPSYVGTVIRNAMIKWREGALKL